MDQSRKLIGQQNGTAKLTQPKQLSWYNEAAERSVSRELLATEQVAHTKLEQVHAAFDETLTPEW